VTDVAVIIVSWNTRELLSQCLAAVFASARPPTLEVWVVDNGSADGSPAMVAERYPAARLIQNSSNAGFSRANNQALRQINSRYALLLNPDATLLPETLPALWAWMEAHPEAGVVGPTLINPNGSFQAAGNDFPGLLSQWLIIAGLAHRLLGPYFPSHGPSPQTSAMRTDWVGGACLLARRQAIQTVGVLDEEYFMYAEETDWCYRMWRAGWEVFWLPAASCIHWRGQSSRQAQILTPARLAQAAYLFFRKHYGQPRTALLQAGMVIFGLAKAAAFGLVYLASGARQGLWKAKIAANWRVARQGLAPQHLSGGTSPTGPS
jgi:N-acetylglucosaminyl-diphospho-decaprenol L-rhamnosyltransferase